jgi:hypothetical protein
MGSLDLNQSPIFTNWDFCPMKYTSAECNVIETIRNEFYLDRVTRLMLSLLEGMDGSPLR